MRIVVVVVVVFASGLLVWLEIHYPELCFFLELIDKNDRTCLEYVLASYILTNRGFSFFFLKVKLLTEQIICNL